VAAVIVVAVAFYWITGTSLAPAGSPQSGSGGSATEQPIATSSVAVPGVNATGVAAGVAVPSVVAAGSVTGDTSYRSFNIKESASAFTPSMIIVNEGDTAHINLTASGGKVDFTQPDLGLSLTVPAGATKVVQFDADAAGKFTFYCKSCGGPSKGPVGYIEVVAQ
jgi:heme/copper-type cytochrome/quinol oxidase subunit 2